MWYVVKQGPVDEVVNPGSKLHPEPINGGGDTDTTYLVGGCVKFDINEPLSQT